MNIKQDTGLYIHIPFCISKCPYCDFFSIVSGDEQLKTRYIRALKKEMALYGQKIKGTKLASIFIGGGTPTILEGCQLSAILSSCYTNFIMDKEAEITVEANPGTIDKEKIKKLYLAGINRISIGAQSFNDRMLKKIGRIHTKKDILTAYQLAREAGFKNINIDIMFGLPGESRKEFRQTLSELISLKPEHISLYALTIEPGTALFEFVKEGKVKIPSDSFINQLFLEAIDTLTVNGYEHYEISNFALPGKRCIHNQIYWKNQPYLGVGVESSSYLDYKRYKNMRDLNKYILLLDYGILPISFQEILPFKERMVETIILRLRTIEGLAKKEFKHLFDMEIEEIFHKELEFLKTQGLLAENETHYHLTKQGILLANNVFIEFMD